MNGRNENDQSGEGGGEERWDMKGLTVCDLYIGVWVFIKFRIIGVGKANGMAFGVRFFVDNSVALSLKIIVKTRQSRPSRAGTFHWRGQSPRLKAQK